MMSYVMTGIILFSQTGLPLHMHYCKGMLESVSVFFNSGCDDHKEIADLPVCCPKATASNCPQNEGSCCDDEVKVLLQDFDSLAPHFDSWAITNAFIKSILYPAHQADEIKSAEFNSSHSSDTGPPIYILFGSLIYYA